MAVVLKERATLSPPVGGKPVTEGRGATPPEEEGLSALTPGAPLCGCTLRKQHCTSQSERSARGELTAVCWALGLRTRFLGFQQPFNRV